MDNEYSVKDTHLSEAARKKKRELENYPEKRRNPMEYFPDMEVLDSDIKDKVLTEMRNFEPDSYGASDIERILVKDYIDKEDLKALLSPAALPYLERLAVKAQGETARHFGNTVYIFTPIYIANYCDNYCVYCGFNRYNNIKRLQLDEDKIKREMEVIARSGMEEVLILTGENKKKSSIEYIGSACKIARQYFKNVGLEIYPANTDDYEYLHECGADYVTVFQETYDIQRYEKLHLSGHKRIWPYRFDTQERALRGGMRGAGFGALLGLSDFRKDAFATAYHAGLLQKKYPAAEISLSVPRLRPIVNNEKINPHDVHERELCQIIIAYRLYLPFAGITVSTRESAGFRDGMVRIAATKVSAGVSTGIGDHEKLYEGDKRDGAEGDAQFKISDGRSLASMVRAISGEGLEPVLNDYLYV